MPDLAALALELAGISALAATGSAVAAAVGLAGVFWQASAANKTNVALILLSFTARYNDPEMAAALRSLAAWRLAHPDESFAADWVRAKADGDAQALKINEYRRLVSRFYFDIARLYQAKLISRRRAISILANNGLNVFYKVCEPLNVANHPERMTVLPDTLRDLQISFGTGELHVPGADRSAEIRSTRA